MWDVDTVRRGSGSDFMWKAVPTPSGRFVTRNEALIRAKHLNAKKRAEAAGKAGFFRHGAMPANS